MLGVAVFIARLVRYCSAPPKASGIRSGGHHQTGEVCRVSQIHETQFSDEEEKESIMKVGPGKGGEKKPAKFPGLVKKLEEAAAKKVPKGEQGGTGSPYGSGPGKKR